MLAPAPPSAAEATHSPVASGGAVFRVLVGLYAAVRAELDAVAERSGIGRIGSCLTLLFTVALAGCVEAVAPPPTLRPPAAFAACGPSAPLCMAPGSGTCTPDSAECRCDESGVCCPRDAGCGGAPVPPPPDTTAPRLRVAWARGPNAEGSFTTLATERALAFAAEVAPDRLAPTVTWSVVDDPGDAARSVVPAGAPPMGATSGLDVPRQPADRWRLPHGASLSARALAFRVVAELPGYGGRPATRDSAVVRQREIDVLRQEYVDFGIPVPAARDVRTAADVAGQTRFAWGQLNQGDYGVAVITPVLVAGLNTLATQWDEPLSLSSVFRNPAHHRFHISVSGGSAKALLSQHQYGTAVDIRTYRNTDTWHRLRNFAKSAGACAEPLDISTSDHVHADWRASAPVCPRGW